MSTQITVTGNLGADPELKFTPNGKAVLELRIAATASRKNPQTQQWEAWGDPLWYKASLWEHAAETLVEHLHKGDKVTLQGVQIVETYTTKQGQTGVANIIGNARFLGLTPRTKPANSNTGWAQQQQSTQQPPQQPVNDPWAQQTQPTNNTDDAPF